MVISQMPRGTGNKSRNKTTKSWNLLGDQEAAKKTSKKTPDNDKGVLSHFSHVQLFVTLWTVAHQAPLSVGILQARILE